jgi:hypothetical protein
MKQYFWEGTNVLTQKHASCSSTKFIIKTEFELHQSKSRAVENILHAKHIMEQQTKTIMRNSWCIALGFKHNSSSNIHH